MLQRLVIVGVVQVSPVLAGTGIDTGTARFRLACFVQLFHPPLVRNPPPVARALVCSVWVWVCVCVSRWRFLFFLFFLDVLFFLFYLFFFYLFRLRRAVLMVSKCGLLSLR